MRSGRVDKHYPNRIEAESMNLLVTFRRAGHAMGDSIGWESGSLRPSTVWISKDLDWAGWLVRYQRSVF